MVSDIDSACMPSRVEQGKGKKDRYAMLSPRLVKVLRAWWCIERPQDCLFPARRPGRPMARLSGPVEA
jgi:integrase/recombinase XerD